MTSKLHLKRMKQVTKEINDIAKEIHKKISTATRQANLSPRDKILNIGLLIGTVLTHYVIFSAFLITVIAVGFKLEWYLALTMIALVVRVAFSKDICPLTVLENVFRKKLGLDESNEFMKDYILNPKKTFKQIIDIL